MNRDGAVDTRDLTVLVQVLSEGLPFGVAVHADVNRDGVLNTDDVVEMLRLLAGGRGGEGLYETDSFWCCQTLPPEGCCGAEFCEEDDDDDSGGGPGGIGSGGGGTVGGGGGGVVITNCDDCSDFEARGPNYAGPGDAVYARLSVGVDHWQYCGEEVTAEIVSGAHLLTNGIYAGDTPGTVRIRISVELSNGTVCSDTHEIEIVRYEPVRLRYATFIECPLEANPAGWIPTVDSDYFGGDDRSFDYLSQSYRSCHERLVAPHLFPVSGPENFPYNLGDYFVPGTVAPFGMSTGYSENDVATTQGPPCPEVLLPGATPEDSATLGFDEAVAPDFTGNWLDFSDGNYALAVRRVSANRIKVYFWLRAGLPLVPGAPPVKGYMKFDLRFAVNRQTGERLVNIWREGDHTYFPAHEIYADDVSLLRYSALNALGGPFGPASLGFGLAVDVPSIGWTVISQN